jgi:glycosyltransferase involved in cell wall biosynthesis
MRRVLVLTPYLYGTAPGPRSSIELWEEVLEPAGISFTYAPFESDRLHEILYRPGLTLEKSVEMLRGLLRRAALMREVAEHDAVLVYREAALIGPELFERLLARTGTPIIYQLDDPLYIPYRSPSNGYLSYLKVFGKVGRIARMSRLTIVNSDQHREYVSRFTDRIVQIPSVVDGDRFTPKEHPAHENGQVCVGWSGSSSTVGNLNVIADPLRVIGARDDARLHFIGAERFDHVKAPHTAQPWSAETEIDDLRRIDVGLLPLPTDEWTKRKFYLKLVQYNALGIPAVCTPLGSNPDVVVHGETGFLARDSGEWVRALTKLIEDRELRAQMSCAAARRAHGAFTLQAQADRIVQAFEGALA